MLTKTVQKFKTKYCADSAEWCPLTDNENLLLVGNYQLVENTSATDTQDDDDDDDPSPNSRVGQLYLFQLDPESTEEPLTICEEIDHSGILDIKWYCSALNGYPTFGIVDADGQLSMFQVMGEESKKLKQIFCENLGLNVLGLSLDWSKPIRGSDITSALLVASSSDGKLSTWQVTDSGLEKLAYWKAHDFEAWISAFDYWNPNLVYSGGDDCRFKGWDLRSPLGHPTFISKLHTMGVCSIQSNANFDHLLATGSYDEQLMLWDNRNMKTSLKDIGLGGGIWRVKWEPLVGHYILTASMHNGFHIVDSGLQPTGDSNLEIVAHYDKHESLAYGVDWHHSSFVPAGYRQDEAGKQDIRTIISCSFYDNSVQLWTWEREIPAD